MGPASLPHASETPLLPTGQFALSDITYTTDRCISLHYVYVSAVCLPKGLPALL